MGLDAVVYCDCFERGRLQTPPRPEWNVYVDESGDRVAKTHDMDLLFAFDRWDVVACDHKMGMLSQHFIGNVSTVGLIRATLEETPDRFPVILSKVVYSGTHCGDFLPLEEVAKLRDEARWLAGVHPKEPSDDAFIREFERKINELIEAALRVGKPIVF